MMEKYNIYKTKNGKTKLHGRDYSAFTANKEAEMLKNFGYKVRVV